MAEPAVFKTQRIPFQLISLAERKKTLKKTEEGNSLEPERVRACHLDLRLTY